MLRVLLLAMAVATAACSASSGPSARYPSFENQAVGLDSISVIVDMTRTLWPLNPGEPREFDAWQGGIVGEALAKRLAAGLRERGHPVTRAVLASQGGSWPENEPKPDRFAMIRSEADANVSGPSGLPIERSPFIVAPDLAAQADARTRLIALHGAIRIWRSAALPGAPLDIAPTAAAAALVAPGQAALVVLEAWQTGPSRSLLLSSVFVDLAEKQTKSPLPRSPMERNIDKTYAESLRLTVIETASGRVLWADAHAVHGGGHRPNSLEAALDTLVSRIPRRR